MLGEAPRGLNRPGNVLGDGPCDVPLHIQDAVGLPVHHVDQQLCLRKVHPTFLVNMELERDSKVCSAGEVSLPGASPECALRCAHVARDPQAWHGVGLDPFNTPQPGGYLSPSELRGAYGLYRQGTLKGDLPRNMWKITCSSKQSQRWMVTCTSSVLTMAPVMLESRLMNSSSNCLTLSGISLIMILTRWSSRRM